MTKAVSVDAISDLLQREIDRQDLTHTEAADRLGVTRQTLYGWLRGQTPSTPEHADAIVGFTGEHKITILRLTGWLAEEDVANIDGPFRGMMNPAQTACAAEDSASLVSA